MILRIVGGRRRTEIAWPSISSPLRPSCVVHGLLLFRLRLKKAKSNSDLTSKGRSPLIPRGRKYPEAGSIRGDAMRKIKAGTIIGSPVTGSRYRVAELLGEGGFGCAYRLHRLDAKERSIEELCLKVTLDPEGWHREAYFGELLKPCDRAIRMYESFPLFPPKKQQDIRYCLVFELAECGTILDYLDST